MNKKLLPEKKAEKKRLKLERGREELILKLKREPEDNNSPILVHYDEDGRYLPFCDNKRSQRCFNQDKNCITSKCKYFQKLRIAGLEEEPSKKMMTHDEIIEDLAKRLIREKMEVCRKKSYLLRNNRKELEISGDSFSKNGEMDIYAINFRRNFIIAIEVKENKCWKNDQKAHRQLRRDLLYLNDLYPNFIIKSMYAYNEPNNRRGYNLENYLVKTN